MNKRTNPILIKYIPHGLNHEMFFPIENKEENKEFQQFKKQIFGDKQYDFVLFFNSRNIRRKKITEIMFAWKMFLDELDKEKADKCCLLLHTQPVDENGTDLIAVREFLFGRKTNNIVFSSQPLAVPQMNFLYNMSNLQILISNAEGWGLSLTEAMLAGNPFIGNVTGGIADQMRFQDESGKWMDYDKNYFSHYNNKFGDHGEWVFPVFPKNRSIVGSVPTPYIFDDNCNFEDVAEEIRTAYNMGPKVLKEKGLKAREWATGEEAGFTSQVMGERIIDAVDELFFGWKPREKYELLNANNYEEKLLNHKIIC